MCVYRRKWCEHFASQFITVDTECVQKHRNFIPAQCTIQSGPLYIGKFEL